MPFPLRQEAVQGHPGLGRYLATLEASREKSAA